MSDAARVAAILDLIDRLLSSPAAQRERDRRRLAAVREQALALSRRFGPAIDPRS